MSGKHGVRPEDVEEEIVEVNRQPCRIWSKGSGPPVVFLAGIGGLPRWTPFLDRLARERRVIAPSMPGHPGSLGHDILDSHLDWLVAMADLLDLAAAPEADLMGVSIGAGLAADLVAIAARCPHRLVLVAPLGMYVGDDPVTDIWAQRPGQAPGLLCQRPEAYLAHTAPPPADPNRCADAGEADVTWEIEQVRAATAEARILWPLGDTGIEHRLHRIRCRTLIAWGEDDQVISSSYQARYAERIEGQTQHALIPEAGHLVDLDNPEALTQAVVDFLGPDC